MTRASTSRPKRSAAGAPLGPARRGAVLPAKIPRADNRLPQILDAAATLFAAKGYQASSIRDIVKVAGMLPGSLYYHFANKDQLLVAVYAEGVRRIGAAVDAALARQNDATEPWARLEAACVAHLESLLARSAYAKVVISVQPCDVPAVARELIALRAGYERQFVSLIAALPLPKRLRSRQSRASLRLLLLGALNWTPTWYDAAYRSGRLAPPRIARNFITLLQTELTA